MVEGKSLYEKEIHMGMPLEEGTKTKYLTHTSILLSLMVGRSANCWKM